MVPSILMIQVTWNDIDQTAKKIHEDISKSGNTFDYVIGLGGSGLVHALLISKSMKVPMLPLMLSSYQGRKRLDPILKTTLGIENDLIRGKKVLIVDDIIASGETMKLVKKYLKESYGVASAKTAVAYVSKLICKEYPDYYGLEYERNEDEWILFPWDNENDFPPI